MTKRKIIAMIPARYGSKRIKKKNLRLIDGQPLISYIVDTVLFTEKFDEIYINSEHDVFEQIANEKGVKFYKRPEQFSTDQSTNDEFGLDFVENTNGDILIQILPTSPFITHEDISRFVDKMVGDNLDSLISVQKHQIASLYKREPINFSLLKPNPPSQTMEPVFSYTTALMAWTYDSFKENMEKHNSAYHGGSGKTDYFVLSGLSTIDIDDEDDWQLAEAIMMAKKNYTPSEPEYYDEKVVHHAETHVETILHRDGVEQNVFDQANKEIVHVKDLLESMDSSKSWSRRVIDTESNSMTIISQLPGEGNRLHYHPNWNEWWYILDGEWKWFIEGEEKTVRKGDVVFMKKNRRHRIEAAGDKPAVRMAVSRADVAHVYPKDE